MRFLEIIVLSVTAGIIVTACLILPEISLSTSSLAVLATTEWPVLAIDWLSGYGLAALLLIAGATPATPRLRTGRAGAMPGLDNGQGPALRRYLLGLGIAQVYSAIVALLGLGAWRLITAGIPPSVAAVAGSAGLRNGLGLILAGVLGGIAVSAAAVARRPNAAVPALSSDTAELRLLQLISESSTAQQRALAAALHEERAQVAAAVEASQRPVLEATKNLTTAVNRLGRGLRRALGEIRDAMPPQGEGWRGPGSGGTPSSTEGATAELWTAVSALSESVARLHDLTPPAAAGDRGIPASLAQLSSELDELLLEIDRDWGEDEPEPQP